MHEVARVALMAFPAVTAAVVWFSLDDATQSSLLKLFPTDTEPDSSFRKASVVTPLEQRTVFPNPVVVALHDYCTSIQADTDTRVDRIEALVNQSIDRGCFNALLADIELLQDMQTERLVAFANLANEQGGVVSEAQSGQASYDLAAIQGRIESKIDAAKIVALGGKTGYCA